MLRKPRTPGSLPGLLLLALVAAVGLVSLVVLTACGGSSGGDDAVAALDDSQSSTSAGDDAEPAPSDPEQAALDFAQCMRDNGVPDFQDPTVNPDGTLQFQGGGVGSGDRAAVQQARTKCGSILQDAGFQQGDGQQRAQDPEFQDALLEFARCMRDNGIDMPDPDFSGGGGGLFSGLRGVDPNSPTFQGAMENCQPILADAGFRPGGNG